MYMQGVKFVLQNTYSLIRCLQMMMSGSGMKHCLTGLQQKRLSLSKEPTDNAYLCGPGQLEANLGDLKGYTATQDFLLDKWLHLAENFACIHMLICKQVK